MIDSLNIETNYLEQLNKEQREAAEHINGPLFVVAGAGTGKTMTLTTRVSNLIAHGIPPSDILAITFTNKAAAEMRNRIIDQSGPHASSVWIHTFHAFSLQILKRHIEKLEIGYTTNFNIIDEQDVKTIIRQLIKESGYKARDFNINELRNHISIMKHFKINRFREEKDLQIFGLYKNHLIQNNLMDFDDLLIYLLRLLKEKEEVRTILQDQFQYILVDEFQDTDDLQYEIIKILAGKHKNIFVVGDPDQSIYAFRGANYQNTEKFLKDFNAKQVILNQNYRSTNNILTAANNLISFNKNRVEEKNLVSNLGNGFEVEIVEAFSDRQEAAQVVQMINYLVNNNNYQYDDFAILYRNNVLSRGFEDVLVQSRIPYIIYGGISFYARKEIKDLIAYLRVIIDSNQTFYLERIINVPAREMGDKTIENLKEYQLKHNLRNLYESVSENRDIPKVNKFYNIIETMKRKFKEMKSIGEAVDIVGEVSGYYQMLDKTKETDESYNERMNNIKEFKSVLVYQAEYFNGTLEEKLLEILNQISLYTSLDVKPPESSVKLATIHQVKGLEFRVVFVAAMEEGLFPSDRDNGSQAELEEERRVAYVAITRAKEKLYLSYAAQRMLYGRVEPRIRSRFLHEVKNEELIHSKTESTPRVASKDLFSIGNKVMHDIFGTGVIVNIDDDVVTIAFKMPHGIKRLQKGHPSIKPVAA